MNFPKDYVKISVSKYPMPNKICTYCHADRVKITFYYTLCQECNTIWSPRIGTDTPVIVWALKDGINASTS
jgi:hypothetical protein